MIAAPVIQLIKSDCIEWMEAQAPTVVDCVVTSPPYNLGTMYSDYEDSQPRHRYLVWLDTVFRRIKHILKDDGSFFLNVGYTNKDPWLDMDVAVIAKNSFVLQNRFHWIKSIFVAGKTKGHFKPIPGKRYVHQCHESVFHFTAYGDVKLDRLAIGVPYEDKSNITRFTATKGEGQQVRCRGNVWFLPYDTIQDRKAQRGKHPATFPVALPETCLRLAGLQPGDLVYDPFVGVGTTMLAAQKLGLSGVGTDIDQGYLDFAAKRLGHVLK